VKRKDRLIALITLGVLLVAGIAGFLSLRAHPDPPKAGAAVTIPVRVVKDEEDTQVIVPVVIHGERFHFLLDTGASTTAVNGTVLKTIRAFDTGQDEDFSNASGDTDPARLFEIHAWSLGPLPLETDAIVSDLAHPLDVDGLLGSDQLQRFGRVTIDYDTEQLIITPRKRR
jgi:predicted aspartyl protease